MNQVGGNCAALGQSAYLTGGQYAAHGAFSQYQYGNGVQRTAGFNSRLQPLTLVDQLTTQTLFNASLSWGTTNNNGNLQSAAYPTGGFTDTFTYDGVNRLYTASDSGGWSRTFSYDAFGNMMATGNPSVTALAFNSNNQIVGKSYDQAGNQLSVNGNTVAYDLENHVVSETDGVSQAVESYVYDGDGRRVEKYGPGGTPRAVFVYDAVGRMAAEYDSTVTIASPCITCYLSDDHLGTARLVTDSNGKVAARHDYLPFGEEVAANTFGRNGTYGSGADAINQKFTGKERDAESGLDYFGARYYASTMGRFMSPDPSNWGVDFYNPQTWNHYSYVGNNPLSNTDPNGLWLKPTHNSIINNAFPGLSKQEHDILQASSKQVDSDQSQAGSYKHGMSSDDNDPYSSTGAYNPTYATNDFIEQNEHNAKEIQADWIASGHTGIAPAALAAFGNAAHTIADEYSPPHQGFQKITGLLSFGWHLARELPGVFGFYKQQQQQAAGAIQSAFFDTFGSDLGDQATHEKVTSTIIYNPPPDQNQPQ